MKYNRMQIILISWNEKKLVISLLHDIRQGSPTHGPQTGTVGGLLGAAGGEQRASEQSFLCRDALLTAWPIAPITAWTITAWTIAARLTLSVEELASTKPASGAKKVGDHWYKEFVQK